MRLMEVLVLDNHSAVDLLYRALPGLSDEPYTRQLENIFHAGIGAERLIAPNLGGRGIDIQIVISDCPYTQVRWLVEFDKTIPPHPLRQEEMTLRQQALAFGPDVVIADLSFGKGRSFFAPLSTSPMLIVGRHVPEMVYRQEMAGEFDIILTSAGLDERHKLESLGAKVIPFGAFTPLREDEIVELAELLETKLSGLASPADPLPLAVCAKARELQKAGNADKSLELLHSLTPPTPESLLLTAEICKELGDSEGVEKALYYVVSLEPENPQSYDRLITFLKEKGEVDKLASLLEEALVRYPNTKQWAADYCSLYEKAGVDG